MVSLVWAVVPDVPQYTFAFSVAFVVTSTTIANEETLDETKTEFNVRVARLVANQVVMDLVGSSAASVWPTTNKLNLLISLNEALAEASNVAVAAVVAVSAFGLELEL